MQTRTVEAFAISSLGDSEFNYWAMDATDESVGLVSFMDVYFHHFRLN